MAISSGNRRIFEVLVAEGRDSRVSVELETLCREKSIPFRSVSRKEVDRHGPGTNGVVARVSERTTISLEQLIESERSGRRLIILLDSIEDPRNLGAILRVAEAFESTGVVTTKDRSASLTAAAAKASAGAAETVKLVRVVNLRVALDSLRERGFWIYGADSRGRPCGEVDLRGDVALVLGGEGEGLRKLTKAHCDELVSVPISKRVESLNVSTAAAILAYETRRQQS